MTSTPFARLPLRATLRRNTRSAITIFAVHGRNNLQAFCYELERRDDEECETGSAPITDAAIAQAQRRARMLDLRGRIDGLEADAWDQENQAYQLGHTGKGKKDAVTKVFNAIGGVPAAKFRLQGEKDRDEAATYATNCVSWKAKTN